MRKRNISAKAEQMLALPTGTLTNGVRLEITDDRRVVMEGCKRIAEYEEDCIRIVTCNGQVRFRGRCLCMSAMTADCAVITGQLLSVEYL